MPEDKMPEPTHEPMPEPPKPSALEPVPTVRYFSTIGFESLICYLGLGVAALGLAGVLNDLIDNLYHAADTFYQGAVSYSDAALIIGLPIFAYMFLRLKKKELAQPEIRRDINRKNMTQLLLVVTFLTGVGTLVYNIYSLLNYSNSDLGGTGSLLGELLHTLVTLAIAGAIFVYYWIDDHKEAGL